MDRLSLPAQFAPKDFECEFCITFSTGRKSTRTFEQFHRPFNGSSLGQVVFTDNFWQVLADVSPLAPDHMMIMPYYHLNAISKAPRDELEHLASLSDRLIAKLRRDNPLTEVIRFEHGTGVINGQKVACGACGFDHAHLHHVPIAELHSDMTLALANWLVAKHSLEMHEIDNNSFVDLRIAEDLPYLYLSDSISQTGYVILQTKLEKTIPSQIIRHKLSTYLYSDPIAGMTGHWHDALLFRNAELSQMIARTLERWSQVSPL